MAHVGAASAQTLWDAVFAGLAGDPQQLAAAHRPAAERFALLTSPALAAYLFGATNGTGFDAASAGASRLLTRFRRVATLRRVVAAGAAGLPVIALKGLGTAHLLYPDPDLRPMADADLLVEAGHLPELLDFFSRQGFRFADMPARSRWGFIGDASFQPLLAADGSVTLDLHVHPDAWPLYHGLDTQAVFAASRGVTTSEGEIRVPSPPHMLLLAASHAARDLFAPHAVKSLLDAALLLRRHQSAIDWDRLTALARAGRSLRPLSVTLALLSALGLPLPTVPETLCRRPRGLAGVEFGRLAASLQALPAAAEATPLQRLRLEWLLAAGPGVSLQRNLRRLRGLVRANPGLPATRANG